MERDEVNGLIYEHHRKIFVDMKCPKCGIDTTMIKFETWVPETDEVVRKMRCLNCLAVFELTLKEST